MNVYFKKICKSFLCLFSLFIMFVYFQYYAYVFKLPTNKTPRYPARPKIDIWKLPRLSHPNVTNYDVNGKAVYERNQIFFSYPRKAIPPNGTCRAFTDVEIDPYENGGPNRSGNRAGIYEDCAPMHFRSLTRPLPITALASAPGSGNTWVRHLIQQLTGEWSGKKWKEYKRNYLLWRE